jgi:ElaB/YqjD/DUF883 family membrane-anchored ribosome-binding protein
LPVFGTAPQGIAYSEKGAMADSNEGASSTVTHAATGMTAETRAERSTSVIAEFIDAACSAAESLLEKQKRQIADRSGGIAEALHRAAHALEASENAALARYAKQAGDRVHDISRHMRERRWDEIIADTQSYARRQPIWFVLGAMATGFLVGRFICASTRGMPDENGASRQVSPGGEARSVTAAVARGSTTDVRSGASYSAGSSGSVETR